MNHVLYRIKGNDKAPQGGGDARSWFYFYKFHPGVDETYWLPCIQDLPVAPGDLLWLAVDADLVGAVPVDRVEDDPLNVRQEIWYRGDQIITIYDFKLGPMAELAEWGGVLRGPWDLY